MPILSPRNTSSLLFALLVLAWTVPYAVAGHTYPVPTFYAEYAAYGLFVLIAAMVGAMMVAAPTLRRAVSPRVAAVPLAFAAVLVAQTLLLHTEQPSMNLLGAGSLLIAALAVHAGYWTGRLQLGEEALRWIAWGLIAGGLFALFCQVVQLCHAEGRFAPFVVSYGVPADRRPFGNMAQANHLATYIAFAFAAAVYLVQSRRLPLAAWIVLAALYSIGLALTVSRTPWLQTAVIFVASLAMAWTDTRSGTLARGWHKGRRWLVPVLTVLIFFAMNVLVRRLNLAFDLHLAESAADRFKDAGQISPRLALWEYGWTMFRTHPWLGVGWGEFPRFQYQLVPQLGRVEIANNSHDIVVDVLAKTGLVGAAIVALGLGLWAWRALRAPWGTARLFALGMLAILAVHALVEYPQQYLFFLLPAAFLIGLLETESMPRLPSRVTAFGYAGVTLAGIAMAYPVLADYHRAEKLYYGQRPEQEYRAAPATIFGAWGEFGLATLLQLDGNGLANKLAMHRKAIALLPGEVILRRYAVLRALDGDLPGAMDQVARLKTFAEALHDWPAQLGLLHKLCDARPALDAFKAQLTARYGMPGPAPAAPASDDDEDDGDDD